MMRRSFKKGGTRRVLARLGELRVRRVVQLNPVRQTFARFGVQLWDRNKNHGALV